MTARRNATGPRGKRFQTQRRGEGYRAPARCSHAALSGYCKVAACDHAAAPVAEAVAAYRAARAAYYAAAAREDSAFARYFAKRQRGEATNGAAVSRLSNLTNYASTELYSAQSALYRHDVDPWDVDDADGVERTPVGS